MTYTHYIYMSWGHGHVTYTSHIHGMGAWSCDICALLIHVMGHGHVTYKLHINIMDIFQWREIIRVHFREIIRFINIGKECLLMIIQLR